MRNSKTKRMNTRTRKINKREKRDAKRKTRGKEVDEEKEAEKSE